MKKRFYVILLIISLIITITTSYTGHITLRYFFKPISTILVLLIPFIYVKKSWNQYKKLIVIGLIFCLFGDVFLMFDSYFLYGLIAFLLGHLFFIIGFTSLAGVNWNIKVLLPFLIYGASIFYLLKPNLGKLEIPVIIYMCFIIVMVWQAVSIYISKRKYPYLLIAVGACLFVASDTFLAFRKFTNPFLLANFLVAITYWTGITLIAFSTIYLKK